MACRFVALLPLALAAALAAAGCTRSMVYSPSVNLPPEPLEAKEIQVMAGVVEMPEVRPQEAPEKTARGFECTARVGATNWLSIQGKFWKDISGNFDPAQRYGISVGTILASTRDFGGVRIGLMPAVVFLCDEEDWYGAGGTLPLCVWLPDIKVIHPYAALGPAYGANDTEDEKWGWGIIENYGVAALLFEHFAVNAEVSLVSAFNRYDKRNDGFITWSVNGGLVF